MEWQVRERTNKNRGDWVPSPGLSHIPKEMYGQVTDTLAAENGRLGRFHRGLSEDDMTQDIRTWAVDHGFPEVAGKRGRLSRKVHAAYNKAHMIVAAQRENTARADFGKCRCGSRAVLEYSPPKGRTQSLCSSCKPKE